MGGTVRKEGLDGKGYSNYNVNLGQPKKVTIQKQAKPESLNSPPSHFTSKRIPGSKKEILNTKIRKKNAEIRLDGQSVKDERVADAVNVRSSKCMESFTDLQNQEVTEEKQKRPFDLFDKQAGTVNLQNFNQVAQGACKSVYILNKPPTSASLEVKESYARNSEFVLYLAKDFKKNKEKELRGELETMRDIEITFFKKTGEPPKNLAVHGVELKDQHGHYVLAVEAAEGDLEKYLSGDENNPVSIEQSVSYVGQFFNGVNEAHLTDHVLGDIKPDNCLIFDNGKQLKVSDFGKTKNLKDYEKQTYTGNPRYMPPEGTLSKAGDTFSSALVAIRLLENSLSNGFDEDIVLKVSTDVAEFPNLSHEKTDKHGNPRIKGIEKFMVQLPSSPHCPSGGVASLLRRLFAIISSVKNNRKIEKSVHSYIDTLTEKLNQEGKINTEQGVKLQTLLKEMTSANPNERPLMGDKILKPSTQKQFLKAKFVRGIPSDMLKKLQKKYKSTPFPKEGLVIPGVASRFNEIFPDKKL